MRKTTLILACCVTFLLGNNISFSQNKFGCNTELSVEKNRSIKSVGENGVFFTLVLKNTSSTNKTFAITASKANTPCKTSKTVSNTTNNNSDLKVSFILANNINEASSKIEIPVNGSNSQKFFVKVEVPEGTPYNTWSCLEINAKPENCSSDGAQSILSVYVTNPSEE